jgi:hypothetical protein
MSALDIILREQRGRKPTFERDFAGVKTLDHGTGPAITFTRGTNASYFDASGTLRFAPNNHIRNSQAGGSTNGVIGSGGAYPLNWTASGTAANGVAVEIIGTGTEDGLAYVDLKFSGTPTTSSSAFLQFDSATQVVAANGQTWTGSAYVKLQGGSLTNVTQVRTFTSGRTSAGATVATQSQSTNFTPNGTALKLQRQIATFAMSDATVERVQNGVAFSYTNGNPIDLTLRIAAPQLELGSTATDYNPTNGTAYFGPRFDHDPATGASRGLLIEESRTNSIRNSQAGGAVAGTQGTAPTNWSVTGTLNSITREIIGTGAEDGLAYIDIKYSGTPSSNGSFTIAPEPSGAVVAANGQTWTVSAYVKLIGGSTSNLTYNLGLNGQTAAGANVAGQTANNATAPTSDPLKNQRRSATFTFTSASVERVLPYIVGIYTNGNPIDLTLRIAAPQLEQGAFATSYIPTTSAAATRAADSAVVTPISSFYNQSEGTFLVEATYYGKQPSAYSRIFSFGNLSANDPDRWFLGFNDSNTNLLMQHFTAGAFDFGSSASSSAGTIYKAAFALALNNGRSALNGSLLGSDDTSVGAPSNKDRMIIGGAPSGTGGNGLHIRKLAYYPRRLSNTLLQQLTT